MVSVSCYFCHRKRRMESNDLLRLQKPNQHNSARVSANAIDVSPTANHKCDQVINYKFLWILSEFKEWHEDQCFWHSNKNSYEPYSVRNEPFSRLRTF